MNTGDIFKAVITEKQFATSKDHRIDRNMSTLRTNNMVSRLGCSLSH